jgi:hypothetical protein
MWQILRKGIIQHFAYATTELPKIDSCISEKQQGSALVEAVIILPLLGMFVLGSYDAYRYFTTYASLSHSAREAAVAATVVPWLTSSTESNLMPTSTVYSNCLAGTITTGCGHIILHAIARRVLTSQQHYIEPSSLQITTQYDSTNRETTIKISAQFKSTIRLFRGFGFNVVEKARNINMV